MVKRAFLISTLLVFLAPSIPLTAWAQPHMIDIEVAKDREWMCLYHYIGPEPVVEGPRTHQIVPPTLRELNPKTPVDPSGAIEGTVEGETYHTRTQVKQCRWNARKEYLIRNENDGNFDIIGPDEKVVEKIGGQVTEYGPARAVSSVPAKK